MTNMVNGDGKLCAKVQPKKTRDELRAIEEQVAKGIYLPTKKIPLFSEVAKDWLEYKKPNLRASTWEVYEGHVRKHVDDLNDLKINRIATATVEKFDLGPTVITALKKWKLACPKSDLNLVFSNGRGNPIDHHNMFRRCFLPTLEAAELPRIRFHDLRHTYIASLLIEQGENIKYVQTQPSLGTSTLI
jgi:integrase